MPILNGLADLEAAYLAARDARDRLDIALARGLPADVTSLADAAATTEQAVRAAIESFDADPPADASNEDARALAAIRAGIETAFEDDNELALVPPVPRGTCEDADAWAAVIEAGGSALNARLEACYGAFAEHLPVGDEVLTRRQILSRLAAEPDGDTRRRLFLGFAPLWRAVDADGDATGPGTRPSPYRAFIRECASRWASGASPIAANERALGLEPGEIERWAIATLEAWRDAVSGPARASGEPPIEPWNWWWLAGEADRAMRDVLPLARVEEINDGYFASLGVDFEAINATFDTSPRPDRPTVPVAYTSFGARPSRRADGTWSPGAPTVFGTYIEGGLGELMEIVHEGGHAIHIAAIQTRPAFADWPDSDALTEALAEVVGLDVYEPAWQERWIPDARRISAATSLRCRYAEIMMDVAWALFEIRLHADPDRSPNEVWTEITSTYLGLAPHPEWSWWAIRGQLVQDTGYMANYQVGAVLAADLRSAIRAARGDWLGGDPGWYDWVTEHVYRFGLERSAGDVLRNVLGRPPDVTALLAEIARARG